ncbi:Uncharacterised protein [uncultured Roseburia sp.]|nr:Uncharacterised protein [uncultured Roseburia sp.]
MSRRFGLFYARTLYMGALALNRSVMKLEELVRK